jgi:hypothetical protein
MKPTRYKKWAVLALALANGFYAAAQLNGVPGPTDYGRFSAFITDRNIFDPGRYSHDPNRPRPIFTPQQQRYAPAFTLVGTMSYEKGMFAFFDGNQSNLRKVLYQSDSNNIAGFTVSEITLGGVKLQTGDKKETLQLKIGEGMRQLGSSWQLASGQGGLFSGSISGESAAPSSADNSGPATSAAPSAAIEGNDVLKKLMQQRQQELK